MINNEADEVIEAFLESLLNKYQNSLEKVMERSEFVFDYVHFFYYKCHKINPNCDGSNMNSPDWIKNKKATINHVNKKDNKCFQYDVTVGVNHEEIGKHSERIKKAKSFVNKYNWEGIYFPSEKDDWKKIEENNLTIALNVCMLKNIYIDIYPTYVSKHNSNQEKQIILLVFQLEKNGIILQ